MKTRIGPILLVALVPFGSTVLAEVLESAPQGFTVQSQVSLTATPDQAYRAFVEKVGKWWDSDHTFFGSADNLSIEPVAQGCFCEKAPSGRQALHLTVVFVDPGKQIRLSGGLGPLQGYPVSGIMSVEFSSEDESTEVTLTYRVSGHVKSGLESWAGAVDTVLNQQLNRFKDFVNSAKP